MTVQDLYEWAKEKDILDYDVTFLDDDRYGNLEYMRVREEDLLIHANEKIIVLT